MAKLSEVFEKIDQWEALLDEADAGCKTDRDISFVSDMRERYKKFGMDTYLSDKQKGYLESLAGMAS